MSGHVYKGLSQNVVLMTLLDVLGLILRKIGLNRVNSLGDGNNLIITRVQHEPVIGTCTEVFVDLQMLPQRASFIAKFSLRSTHFKFSSSSKLVAGAGPKYSSGMLDGVHCGKCLRVVQGRIKEDQPISISESCPKRFSDNPAIPWSSLPRKLLMYRRIVSL